MKGHWYISFTPVASGDVWAWATKIQPPRNATLRDMMTFSGEVHFACGRNAAEARDRLEADLP